MLEWINANLAYVILGAISFVLLILVMIMLFHKEKEASVSNKGVAAEALDLMQKSLNNKPEVVTNYEDDQENKAIISYKELVKSKEETEKKENKIFSSVDEYFDYLNSEEKKPVETKIIKEEIITKTISNSKEADFLKELKEFRNKL